MIPLLVTVLTVLDLFSLFQLIDKADHCLLVVVGAVGVSKYDVSYGIIMLFLESPN